MGAHALSERNKWQARSGQEAAEAEKGFYEVFWKEFKGTDFRIRAKPGELKDAYSDVKLSESVASQTYCPGREFRHGLIPDYAIDNIGSRKTLYVDIKRQNGWVEGKLPKDGRGNVHERSCKFFAPGLQKILRRHGNLGEDALPFFVVFQGDIARDPKRVREITCWYGDYQDHFFMWIDSSDPVPLVQHFNSKLKPLLL